MPIRLDGLDIHQRGNHISNTGSVSGNVPKLAPDENICPGDKVCVTRGEERIEILVKVANNERIGGEIVAIFNPHPAIETSDGIAKGTQIVIGKEEVMNLTREVHPDQ